MGLLYEAQAKDATVSSLIAELPLEPDPYALDLALGVDAHRDELDAYIVRYAQDWTIERMPVLDRTLLRMAVYELTHRADVPTGVVISEAVELAKTYSTPDSGRFVNGMLSRIADEVRPAGGPRPPN